MSERRFGSVVNAYIHLLASTNIASLTTYNIDVGIRIGIAIEIWVELDDMDRARDTYTDTDIDVSIERHSFG